MRTETWICSRMYFSMVYINCVIKRVIRAERRLASLIGGPMLRVRALCSLEEQIQNLRKSDEWFCHVWTWI